MLKQGRPDFSEYVGHFTKNSRPLGYSGKSKDLVKDIKGTAAEKLISILNSRKINATPMPWTNKPAVAFTECTWGSLLAHTMELSAVKFVILPSYKAMAAFPTGLKDGIGREKFILTEVYRYIEQLWPVHLM